jgi:hypothetical protein
VIVICSFTANKYARHALMFVTEHLATMYMLTGGYARGNCPQQWVNAVLIYKTNKHIKASLTFRAGQPGQDSWDRTARKGKPEQDSPNGTRKMVQGDDGMQISNEGQTVRTGLPVHACQYRTARTRLQRRTAKTGLLGNDFRDRTARADFAMV